MLKASKTRCCRSWTCRMKPPTSSNTSSNRVQSMMSTVSFPRIAMHIPSCRSPIQTSTASYRLAVKRRGWKDLERSSPFLNRTRVMVSPVSPHVPSAPSPSAFWCVTTGDTISTCSLSGEIMCVTSLSEVKMISLELSALDFVRWQTLRRKFSAMKRTVLYRPEQTVVFMTLYSFRRIQFHNRSTMSPQLLT